MAGLHGETSSSNSSSSSSSSESEGDDILPCLALLVDEEENRQRRRRRQWWVRPWIGRREQLGAYHALLAEMQEEDVDSYRNFLRMDPHHFQQLLNAVSPLIEKEDTHMRASIAPGERLAVTLRFLASGDSFQSLCYLYRIGRSTLSGIIPETCQAICDALRDRYMKVPSTEEGWATIAKAFEDKWQFPNCVGALDGKHIAIKAPINSGSMFYNYKNFHSIVLLALVDAHYRIITYDLGVNGRNSDAGIYGHSALSTALEENTLNLPPPRQLPGTDTCTPHMIVGDEAFPLKTYLQKPYPHRGLTEEQRVFNYRLSRARRVSENAFGILVNRFAVLARTMNLQPETASVVTEACLVLHNFLRTECDVRYAQDVVRPGHVGWRMNLGQQAGNRHAEDARAVRDTLRDYFTTVGAVPWQWDHVH